MGCLTKNSCLAVFILSLQYTRVSLIFPLFPVQNMRTTRAGIYGIHLQISFHRPYRVNCSTFCLISLINLPTRSAFHSTQGQALRHTSNWRLWAPGVHSSQCLHGYSTAQKPAQIGYIAIAGPCSRSRDSVSKQDTTVSCLLRTWRSLDSRRRFCNAAIAPITSPAPGTDEAAATFWRIPRADVVVSEVTAREIQ